MSSNPCFYIDHRVETIRQQTGCVWLVGHRLACGCTLSVRPVGSTPAQSLTWTAPLQLRYAAWGSIQVLYAFALGSVLADKASWCYTQHLTESVVLITLFPADCVWLWRCYCCTLLLVGVVGTLAKLAKAITLRITTDKLYFILSENLINGGIGIWCEILQVSALIVTSISINTINYYLLLWSLAGGIAQWLGCRSLAGGLSLIYAVRLICGCHVTTLWVRYLLWVNQPTIPLGR